MQYKHPKSGASFSLPDDLTHAQLEAWEQTLKAGVAENVTPAVACRLAVRAAMEAGFLTPGDGFPTDPTKLGDASARLMWWAGDVVGKYIASVKSPEVDPNS